MSQWIKTQSGRLCNLALMSKVGISVEKEIKDRKEYQTFVVAAYEVGYEAKEGDRCVIATYATRAEAQQAINDLFDWLSPDVASDFTADEATVDFEAVAVEA